MTDCAIETDLAHTRTYEAGAILLAVLALPGEDENTRGGLIFSRCHLALQARFDLRASEAQVDQPIKPIYAFRSGDDLRGDLRKLKRLLRDRMLAARMAIPLLQKAMGVLPSQLPEGLAKLTLDELSTWVARELTEETPYEVGYGRPPKHTQFKKGQSGNCRNRQKKNLSFAALIDKAFSRRIPARDGAERRHITILEAVTRQLVDSAARGDADALDLLMQLDQ